MFVKVNYQTARVNSPGRLIVPDLLTFAIFRLFQAQKSSFQDTNGLVGDGLKLNAWHLSVK